MKAFRYAIFGLIVGATLGAVLSSGQLSKHDRTKQKMTADFATWQWAFYGGVVGAVVMGLISAWEDKRENMNRKRDGE